MGRQADAMILPWELLYAVFERLDFDDLQSASLCCRKAYEECCKRLWVQSYIVATMFSEDDLHRSILMKHSKHIKRLTIDFDDPMPFWSGPESHEYFEQLTISTIDLLKISRNIEEIFMVSCSWDHTALYAVLEALGSIIRLPHLHTLGLHDESENPGTVKDILPQVFIAHPSVTRLSISQTWASSLALTKEHTDLLPYLTDVTVQRMSSFLGLEVFDNWCTISNLSLQLYLHDHMVPSLLSQFQSFVTPSCSLVRLRLHIQWPFTSLSALIMELDHCFPNLESLVFIERLSLPTKEDMRRISLNSTSRTETALMSLALFKALRTFEFIRERLDGRMFDLCMSLETIDFLSERFAQFVVPQCPSLRKWVFGEVNRFEGCPSQFSFVAWYERREEEDDWMREEYEMRPGAQKRAFGFGDYFEHGRV